MLVYLHGFNSSPQSHKARVLERTMERLGRAAEYACPTLPPSPRQAIAAVEQLVARHASTPVCFIGSSLGGFYATYLAETQGSRAVLINPAVEPHVGLRAYVGPQKNLYSGEAYELTETHLRELEDLYRPRIEPKRYFLMVETGDEVLDYRQALARYAGARQSVVAGGDHSLRSFPEQLSRVLRFAS